MAESISLTKEESSQDVLKKRKKNKSDLIFLLIKAAVIAAIAFITFFFIFGLSRSSDNSMKPAIKEGDLILYYRLASGFSAGDVVVLKDDNQVRRIIAVAGDTIDIDENGLIINGYGQQEQEIYTETMAFTEGITFPVTLADGEYFVLGDNRTQSKDSRLYGPVTKADIKGKVMTILRRRGF